MGTYVPNMKQEQQEILHEIGFNSFEKVSSHIPGRVMLRDGIQIPSGLNKQAVMSRMEEMAGENMVSRYIFRGVGAYNHYIPVIVSSVISKEEFIIIYTPYQVEISQGILQSISEYQTMIYELAGTSVSSASVYNGVTAAGEAVVICRGRKRSTAYVSVVVSPGAIEVIKTYRFGSNTRVIIVPEKDGVTNTQALEDMIKADPQVICPRVQQPNYYGNLEDGEDLGCIAHEVGAKYIMSCNPTTLAAMKASVGYGANIAVGDGQPLGVSLALGDPYLGFMAATAVMTRKLPGRIVGKTTDSRGERAFAFTLRAREQYIRREKASSNVCSNRAWRVLTASVYITAMGAGGMEKATMQRMSRAHYSKDVLKLIGLEPRYDRESSHKFVTIDPEGACSGSAHTLGALERRGAPGGLPPSDREIPWYATETDTEEEMDEIAPIVRNVLECGHKGVCGS